MCPQCGSTIRRRECQRDDILPRATEAARADAPPRDNPDATDPCTQQRARRRKAKVEDEARAFWRRVLATPDGRREVWQLLEAAHWREKDFASTPIGFPDVNATFYRLGQRDYGLWLYHTLLGHDRDGVLTMLDDHDPRFVQPAKARGR